MMINEYFENRFIECYSFLDVAFSVDEQNAIWSTSLVNESNPYYGTDGGKNTEDKIFLLAASDVYGTDSAKNYGFAKERDVNDEAKRCKCSDYAKAMGTVTSTTKDYADNCWWWLRTPGREKKMSMGISVNGWVSEGGSLVTEKNNGIRPAIYLDLSCSDLYYYAGTVCSDGIVDEGIFNETLYKAGILFDMEIPSSRNWNDAIARERICARMLNALKKNGMDTAAQGWRDLHDMVSSLGNPANGMDFVLREQDMYEALIFSVLAEASTYTLVNKAEKVESKVDDIVSSFTQNEEMKYVLKSLPNIKWSDLSPTAQEEVLSAIMKNFEKTKSGKISKILETAGKILDLAGSVKEGIKYVCAYVSMYHMSDAVKQVIKTLYEQCPSTRASLKYALRECYQVITSSNSEFLLTMTNGALRVVGNEMLTQCMAFYWKDVKTAMIAMNPNLKILIAAYTSATCVTNVLFNTDATVEAYFNMVAMDAFHETAKKAYNLLKSQYENVRTEDSAEIYLSAADVMYRCMDADCRHGLAYVSALDDSFIGRLESVFGKTTVQENKEAIEDIQKNYKMEYYQILTAWVNYLEQDGYSEEYKKYEPVFKKPINEMTASYQIECPVDVYIYDNNSELAASVVRNVPTTYTDDITITVENDVKTLYFYGAVDSYDIRYVGTDTGTMDVTIKRYEADMFVRENTPNTSDKSDSSLTLLPGFWDNGLYKNPYGQSHLVRTVNFNKLKLVKGKEYRSAHKALITMHTSFSMYEGEDEIEPDYDSGIWANASKKHKISVKQGILVRNEIPAVSADAVEGEKIEISACVPEGYIFEGWDLSDPTASAENPAKSATYFYVGKKDCVVRPKLRKKMPVVGTVIKDKKSNGQYKVLTSEPQKVTLQYLKPMNKKVKSVNIVNSIKINGISCKVTLIAPNALKGNKKVKKVTIGKYITSIGDKAFYKCTALTKVTIPINIGKIGRQVFYGCKNLKSIIIKSKVLKKIGNKAFKGINKKAKIKVPKTKLKAYKRLLKGKGQAKSVKISKY